MILDTENIPSPRASTTTVWAMPPSPQLDHRLAQLEATVAAQARELSELRLALKGVVAALNRYESDS
jgi:hypothetical protein